LFFTCLSRCRSRYAVNLVVSVVLRVLRYQRGNHYPYIEEQITQWPREKGQKDKKQSTQHTYKTKDPVTRTPLKSGVELECSGRVSNSCICSILYFKINDLICWCLNATFSNISAISWRAVLVVEGAGVLGENHPTWASNW
jgi:hypothetical protein